MSQLTKLSGLRVIPVRPGDRRAASIPDVVRDLNVATVLGGSVYYSEGRVRVTPRLTRRRDRRVSVVGLVRARAQRHLRDPKRDRPRGSAGAAASSCRRPSASASSACRPPIREHVDLYLHGSGLGIRSRARGAAAPSPRSSRRSTLDPEFTEAWVLDSHLRTATLSSSTRNTSTSIARAASKPPVEPSRSTRSSATLTPRSVRCCRRRRTGRAPKQPFAEAMQSQCAVEPTWASYAVLAAIRRQVRRLRARHFRGGARGRPAG